MSKPGSVRGPWLNGASQVDHDQAKENWARVTNRYCDCPPWRYSPAHNHMRVTNPECAQHGTAAND